MMSAVLCRRTCGLMTSRRLSPFSTMSALQSRDRFYINDEPANISLPDSYAGRVQGLQGREHEFAANRAKDTVDFQANDVERSMEKGIGSRDEHAESYDDSCNVSLHSVMQSNVPEPYQGSSPTHMNMPGGGVMRSQRFESNRRIDLRGEKKFHTYSPMYSQGSAATIPADFQPPSAQGVQGDDKDCTLFNLWLENCHRYNLDCDEMLQGVQSGRKTLSQVFKEQDEMIRKVVEESKVNFSSSSSSSNTSTQGPTDGPNPSQSNDPNNQLSQKDRLKKAVKEYGSTVIVFHIVISLMSLGGFYALVSR
jgi:hypothetical protein